MYYSNVIISDTLIFRYVNAVIKGYRLLKCISSSGVEAAWVSGDGTEGLASFWAGFSAYRAGLCVGDREVALSIVTNRQCCLSVPGV